MRAQVRVQKKYIFEFKIKFEFGKMIEFFRVQVRVRSPACTITDSNQTALFCANVKKQHIYQQQT